ncbi:hypothetical protein THRCLA_23057 [Thraustotheca clavata]|uniref:Uncharacterized protein n=1 Tax=Thraustotheca clavata TaxID=74557 RepID=A0A1V9YHG1_9STRA|nr:hypothetical protein THRCLA_23057 [Thraustotheca clavata]
MPITPLFTLHRDCYTENMDMMVYCSSGSIEIGNWKRAVLIVSILVYTVVFCSIIISVKPKKTCHRANTSAVAVAFLHPPTTFTSVEAQLDITEAAMVGILSFKALGKHYFFYTKVWLPLSSPSEITIDGGIALLPNAVNLKQNVFVGPKEITIPQIKSRAKKFDIFGGVIYVVISLLSNFANLYAARSLLFNDFG